MGDREIRSDSKLKGDAITDEQHQELWDLRYPAGEAKQMSLDEIAATEVPRICGFTCSPSTLSEYYKWAKLRKRSENARKRAEQGKLELLKQNPDASQEELEKFGQMIFTSETITDGNLKGFIALLGKSLTQKKMEQERNAFEAKLKISQEKLELAEKKVKQDERRLKLLEKKAKERDEASEQWKQLRDRDAEMSEAEREAALKLIDEKLLGLR